MTPNRQTPVFEELIAAQKRGESRGIYAVCSAEGFVLEAAFRQALADGSPLLIEATCNQVNQFGGYTGMTPPDFYSYVNEIATATGFPPDNLILGGDHLGPNVWQTEPAAPAMEKALALVRAYVQAGFTKIHLDASMPLGGDPPGPIDSELAARRAAALCQAAEMAAGENASRLRYVIGTEVPPPGGALAEVDPSWVTQPEHAQHTIEISQAAFAEHGLEEAWERVIAVVVQPGVEFGDQEVVDYRPELSLPLSRFIESFDHLVYEAHSTDYQLPSRLQQLVAGHFAILKVGPALTFALREAVFALAQIEDEALSGRHGIKTSQLRAVLESAMQANPRYWQKYYHGDPDEVALARYFSYSDRIRYYWSTPAVQAALQQLIQNLGSHPIPASLLSQYLPVQYWKIRDGSLENSPRAFIQDKIQEVLQGYAYACSFRKAPDPRVTFLGR